jgi:sugar phosphate isomerase/epimerase
MPNGPRVHVHVPYDSFWQYHPLLAEHKLSIELYFGTNSVDRIRRDDVAAIRDAMDWEHTLTVHGPFMDLSPGALDAKVAEASLSRYLAVIDLSSILSPEAVVFHSGYEGWKYAHNVDIWLKPSVKTWERVVERAEPHNIRIAVENIVDTEPDHLKLLADEVGHPLFGLCLDVGHREIFSDTPIDAWVDKMHPHIHVMHLHDNTGEFDDHAPIGEGSVDFGALFARIRELGIDPVYTLEAHNADDAFVSLKRLSKFLDTPVP